MNDDETQDLLRDMRIRNDELAAERDRYKAALQEIVDTLGLSVRSDPLRIARRALANAADRNEK